MDWTLILTLVFGVATLVSIIIAVRLARRKKPVWACETAKIIGLGSNAPPELGITFGDKPVSDVFRSMLILFNKGNDTIRDSDVTENFTFVLKGGQILRPPIVSATSKQQIKFQARQVVRDWNSAVEVTFKYLDHNDGGRFEVLHTSSEPIYCEGNIMGVKEIIKIQKLESYVT